jgi:hypothetical protein
MVRTQVQSNHLFDLPLMQRADFGRYRPSYCSPRVGLLPLLKSEMPGLIPGNRFQDGLKLTLQEEA